MKETDKENKNKKCPHRVSKLSGQKNGAYVRDDEGWKGGGNTLRAICPENGSSGDFTACTGLRITKWQRITNAWLHWNGPSAVSHGRLAVQNHPKLKQRRLERASSFTSIPEKEREETQRKSMRSSVCFFSRKIASQISRENYPIVLGCNHPLSRSDEKERATPPPSLLPPRISSLGYVIGFLFHVFIPLGDLRG